MEKEGRDPHLGIAEEGVEELPKSLTHAFVLCDPNQIENHKSLFEMMNLLFLIRTDCSGVAFSLISNHNTSIKLRIFAFPFLIYIILLQRKLFTFMFNVNRKNAGIYSSLSENKMQFLSCISFSWPIYLPLLKKKKYIYPKYKYFLHSHKSPYILIVLTS